METVHLRIREGGILSEDPGRGLRQKQKAEVSTGIFGKKDTLLKRVNAVQLYYEKRSCRIEEISEDWSLRTAYRSLLVEGVPKRKTRNLQKKASGKGANF